MVSGPPTQRHVHQDAQDGCIHRLVKDSMDARREAGERYIGTYPLQFDSRAESTDESHRSLCVKPCPHRGRGFRDARHVGGPHHVEAVPELLAHVEVHDPRRHGDVCWGDVHDAGDLAYDRGIPTPCGTTGTPCCTTKDDHLLRSLLQCRG